MDDKNLNGDPLDTDAAIEALLDYQQERPRP